MSDQVLGAAVGMVLSIGLLTAAASLARSRTPSLEARVAPYLPDGRWRNLRWARHLTAASGAATRRERVRDTVRVAVGARPAAWIDRLLGGRGSLAWRLDVMADPRGVEEFRVDQALGAGVGALLGLGAGGLVSVVSGGVALLSAVVLAVAGIVLGALVPDWRLTAAAKRRDAAMAAELPVVAELIALAVTAGEGVLGAIERVTTSCGGILSAEFGRVLADVRSGSRLSVALGALSSRTRLASVGRLVDAMVVAMERGTPLGEVLRAQAIDLSSARRQELVEESGRRSIAMLLPVVFMILPVTVLFAVYPGLVNIVSMAR